MLPLICGFKRKVFRVTKCFPKFEHMLGKYDKSKTNGNPRAIIQYADIFFRKKEKMNPAATTSYSQLPSFRSTHTTRVRFAGGVTPFYAGQYRKSVFWSHAPMYVFVSVLNSFKKLRKLIHTVY